MQAHNKITNDTRNSTWKAAFSCDFEKPTVYTEEARRTIKTTIVFSYKKS